MIKAENKNNSKSVEHLIPNTALTKKRKNDEGDFYACRNCNSRKSNIDYILGVLSKAESDDQELAANTLIKAVTKADGASNKFINMVKTVKETANGVIMTTPLKGEEIVEYIEFLGKGQYFKEHKVAFNPERLVMKMSFTNKQVTSPFKNSYTNVYNSNPFRDLEENKYSEVINGGECIIYSKNKGYMFVFHDYTIITVKILKKNKKNMLISQEKINEIINDFNKNT